MPSRTFNYILTYSVIIIGICLIGPLLDLPNPRCVEPHLWPLLQLRFDDSPDCLLHRRGQPRGGGVRPRDPHCYRAGPRDRNHEQGGKGKPHGVAAPLSGPGLQMRVVNFCRDANHQVELEQ